LHLPWDVLLSPVAGPVTSYSLPPDLYRKARSLAHVRLGFEIGGFVYVLGALWLTLRWKVAPRIQDWSARLSRKSIFQGLFFAPILIAWLALLELPPQIASHWTARIYGISIQGWRSWAGDWSKALGLEIVLGSVVIWGFYFLLRRSPRRWWMYAWLASLPLILVAVFAEPLLIEPMFHRFAPLQEKDPSLVAQIECVADRAGVNIPPARIFWMRASDKTPGMNAYVAGIGTSKRVVVWDTTIGQETTPEIVAVFGHELGHYVLGHVWKGMAGFSALLLLFLYAESYLVPWLVARRGGDWGIGRIGGWASLPAFLLVLVMLMFAADPIANGFSRWMEHRADVYGLEVTHGILADAGQAAAKSFQREGEISLADPAPNPLDVFWFYDHPPIPGRVRFCASYNPWRSGRRPEFVK